MKKVAFHTLGCRLNFSETGSVAQQFAKNGYQIVELHEPSDVVYINTCTVTDGADSACRNIIRRARRSSPGAKIVVAGCYAQMEADKIKAMNEVDLILGTSEKYDVFKYLENEREKVQVQIGKSSEFKAAATSLDDGRTRAFLKIQDGCNYVCSFCIIPFARGRSRCLTVQEAVDQAKKLVDLGFKEIVLTGVNIGEYYSAKGENLTELVKRVLGIGGLKRFRLSSVEPNTLNRELLEVLSASNKVQDHFHIPLQSGDDVILKSMRRKYDLTQYQNTVDMVRSYFPLASIGADIIVGYPGESREQFENTYAFLEAGPITHFHVFPYSKRKGTTAARMSQHIATDSKKERVNQLIRLGESKIAAFAKSLVGSENDVLFEKQDRMGQWCGYTSNYLKLKTLSKTSLSNQVRRIRITSTKGAELMGELVDDDDLWQGKH